jgi:hypothetical protein
MVIGVLLSHSQQNEKAPVTQNITIFCLITYVPTVVMQAPQQFAPQHEHHCLLATYSSPAAQAEALLTPQVPIAWHAIRHLRGTNWAVVVRMADRRMKRARVNTAKGTCRRNVCVINICVS